MQAGGHVRKPENAYCLTASNKIYLDNGYTISNKN